MPHKIEVFPPSLSHPSSTHCAIQGAETIDKDHVVSMVAHKKKSVLEPVGNDVFPVGGIEELERAQI